MKPSIRLTSALAALTLMCGCSNLSKEAKEIVGTYYNTELRRQNR